MRAPVTRQVLQDKESLASMGAASHHQVATQLVAWATHPHDKDEVPAAQVWVAAGEQFALGDEHTDALHAYQRAAECAVATIPDARGFIIKALLDLAEPTKPKRPPISYAGPGQRPQSPITWSVKHGKGPGTWAKPTNGSPGA